MRGRKRIPSKIIDLYGGTEHTHRPPRKDEPKPPEHKELPPCPRHLDKDREAHRIWRSMGPVLLECGLLTKADVPMFADWCRAWSAKIGLLKELSLMRKIDAIPKDAPAPAVAGQRVLAYHLQYRRWRQAFEKLGVEPFLLRTKKGAPIDNAWIRVEREANAAMMRIERTIKRELGEAEELIHKGEMKFGLSPSSRASLKVETPKEPGKVAQFMSRKNGG